MEVEHPLFTQINFPYSKQMVKAYPLKNPQEDTRTDLKNIVLQNNFTNISLNTLVKQLTRMERLNQQFDALLSSSKNVDKRVKNSSFKHFQISKSPQNKIKSNKTEFLQAIRDQISMLEPTNSKTSNIVSETPQTIAQSISVLYQNTITLYEEAF